MNKLRKLVDASLVLYYQSQLRKDQWKDPQQLKKIQFKKLKSILKHAYEHVPYYHRSFSSAKIRPEDIRDQDDLRKVPLTSKQDLQENCSCIVQRGIDVSKLYSSFTSGSTGIPSKIIQDRHYKNHSGATERYSFFESGTRLGDIFVTVWGRTESILWPKNYAKLWGGISETVVPLYKQEKLIRILRHINPDVINTFPSVLSSIATYNVSRITPRLIFTQGEVVTQHCRDLVRKMFDIELFEIYGSVEFGHLAFECTEHNGLHIITNNTNIEFLDEGGDKVAPEEQGEIVVTGLHNRVMPLIRYRIGDVGIPTDEKCSCGRAWPLLRNVQGRINDDLVLPSGRKISWLHFYHQFYKEMGKNVFSISQYRIIQDKKDRIIFEVVKGKDFDPKMLERIRDNLGTFFAKFGEKIEVIIEIVKEIPLERTGKRRILISKVAK